MKNIIKLKQEFSELLISLNCNELKCFNTSFTGNMKTDFSQFTDDESGKKSDDINDPAAKDSPNSPDTDGHYYHTIRDITWNTYHSIFPNNPPQFFYAMTDLEREACIQKYFDHANYTNSDLVNILFAFFAWGSWDYQPECSLYKEWYNSDIIIDSEDNEHDVFVRLIDIRKWRYSQMTQADIYGLGWVRALLCFFRLFIQYTK